jgi:hypothetical protein
MAEKRIRSIKIYVTDPEYAELYKKAKELDLSVTTYIYRYVTEKPLEYGLIERD